MTYIGVDSPLGRLSVWSNNASHIGVQTDKGYTVPEGVVDHVTVNRVPYSFRIHLSNKGRPDVIDHAWYAYGEWGARWNNLFMSRADKYTRDEPSHSAKTKLLDTLVPWLAEWAESPEGRTFRREAGRRAAEQRLASLKRKEVELAEEIAIVQKQIRETIKEIESN